METPVKLDAPQQNVQTAVEGLEHVEALLADPHFAWFLKEVLEAARNDELTKAVDVQKTSDERTAACHRLALARELCGTLEKRRGIYTRLLDRA